MTDLDYIKKMADKKKRLNKDCPICKGRGFYKPYGNLSRGNTAFFCESCRSDLYDKQYEKQEGK